MNIYCNLKGNTAAGKGHNKRARFLQCSFLLLALATGAARVVAQTAPAAATNNQQQAATQRFVREGVAVEFSVAALGGENKKAVEMLEGRDATVSFKITDTATGTPLTNLRPSAWVDYQSGDKASDAKECREKIQSFLRGSLGARPEIDLNTYYLLVLNKEPNISVIDPLLGFGTSKLLTLILLDSPGEDWTLSRDGKRLFVTLPLVNRVAVIDTRTFKVLTNIDVGVRPTRVAFQPDEKYLWVCGDGAGDSADSGVTVIDSASLKVAARIRTGAGHHEIAFTPDDRFAFVTNQVDNTLSVIEVQKLAKIKDVKTGRMPVSMAYSPLSKAVYVASEYEGTITVMDAQSHAVIARIRAKPGLKAVRFAPEGRWGFAANSKENGVYIFDSSDNSIAHTVAVGRGPDQITFTQGFAYIRSVGTEQVYMIPLAGLSKGVPAKITQFPGGQYPAEKAGTASIANIITPAPEGNTVMVANPADRMIYYYAEGMTAPMGNFQNYRREPKGVLIVDRSMRETAPGIYTNTVRLPGAGNFDVVFLTDSPRIAHCFQLTVKPDPDLKREKMLPLEIEPLVKETKVRVEESVRLRFKLTDSQTKQPRTGLKDVGVLTFLAPGIWQSRQWARSNGEGVYEVNFVPPKPGVYYVFVECPSLGVRLNQLPYLILHATKEDAKP